MLPQQKRLSQGLLRPSVLELLSSRRRESSPPSMQAWVQEDNPCRHSETGDLGKGFKKYIYIFYIGFFLAVAITWVHHRLT